MKKGNTTKIISRSIKEKIIRCFFFLCSLISVGILGLILFSLSNEGLPLFKTVALGDFVLGMEWYPTFAPPSFGIFPLIVASLIVTFISMIFAVPISILLAIFIAEVAPKSIRGTAKAVVELLAGLPSVVLGFLGMVVIAPFLQDAFNLPTGLNIINASLILSVMAIPTITSLAEDAINAVPKEYRAASYALCATKFETILFVIIPCALSGISTAIILGMARVIGETMVVLMVAGGASALPESIFDSVRPMPASIAAEMGETPYGSLHYQALFAIGIVLFFITLAFNFLADYLSHKFREGGSASL
ncbi:MAG: phosphate ABC transporter permease subunit PstC [Deltaproteobacteria bacterium]